MNKTDLAIEGAKGTPPWVVALVANFKNWDSAATISALTMLYLALQIAWLIWRWRKEATSDGVGK